jgi:hypothetical protein
MRRLRKHGAFLRALCNLNQAQRKVLLKHLTADQTNCLSELALNLLNFNLPVPTATRSKLRKHRAALRKLANKNSSVKRRKKIVQQTGGFLPLLIKPALALLSGILGG